MKQQEMTREVKARLWQCFDNGLTAAALPAEFSSIPNAAIVKQFTLWQEFRTRNPKR